MTRGRPFSMGICRNCDHRNYQHGYVGPVHTCGGCRDAGRPECERYVRDRRKGLPLR